MTTTPGARLAAALLAVVALAFAGLVATAGPAAAHATLVSTDPAEGDVLPQTPDVVTFTFDEPVSLPADGVQAFDAAGEPVQSQSSSRDAVITTDLPDELADGTYVLVWRAISADGHPIAGSLTFSVGEPSAEVAAPQVAETDPGPVSRALGAAQALQYVGLLAAAGLLVLLGWTARGVRLDDAVRARVVRVAWWATGLALLAGVAGLPLAGAYQQGLPLDRIGEADAVALDLIGWHLVVLALQAAGLVGGLVLLARRGPLAAGLALIAAVSPALVGHSRAIDPVWLMLVTDVTHLVAGTAWLGGLLGLVLVLGSLAGRERNAALVLSRFSVLAAGSLGLLAVTGTLMGWRILEGWAPLFDTTYGRLLLVKVGIAAIVALVAGYNRFRLLPGAVDGVGHDARRRGVLRVRSAVRLEAGLIVVLLGVTGFLTNQSPREAAAVAAPVASRVSVGVAGELKVLATATPARRGPNTVLVQVQDQSGEPYDGFAEPEVSISGADVDLGPQAVVPVAAGTYEVDTVLPTPGTWTVQVSLRLSEFENPVTTAEIEVQ